MLNIVRHTIELSCPADAIPQSIEFSLAGLDIGDSIHISAVTLPAGVTPTITDRDFTVATIASSSAMKPEEEEGVALQRGSQLRIVSGSREWGVET